MVVQDILAQPGNVVETESSVKETFDSGFIGGIEYRAGGATSPGHLEAKSQGRKRLEIGWFKVE